MELKDYTSEELIEEISKRDLLSELDEAKQAFLKEKRIRQISYQFFLIENKKQVAYSLKYLKENSIEELRKKDITKAI